MKRILAILLAVTMAVVLLAACGAKSPADRAEEILRDVVKETEKILDEQLTFLQNLDPDNLPEDWLEQLEAKAAALEEKMESYDEEMEEIMGKLTQEETDRLEALRDELFAGLEEKYSEFYDILSNLW